jgi:hypothetical protein
MNVTPPHIYDIMYIGWYDGLGFHLWIGDGMRVERLSVAIQGLLFPLVDPKTKFSFL